MKAFFTSFFLFILLFTLQSQPFSLLKDIESGDSDGLSLNFNMLEFKGEIYFTSSAGTLWKTDGTTAGTKEFLSRTVVSGIENISSSGANIFFEGYKDGNSLFVSNGTTSGSQKVKDLSGLEIEFMTPFTDFAIIFGVQNFSGSVSEIWVSGGLAANTRKLTDMEFSYPFVVSKFQDKIIVQDEFNGFNDPESIITDGTISGTVSVVSWLSDFVDLEKVTNTVGGEDLVFITGLVEEGGNLWSRDFVSDGTEAGTFELSGVFGDFSKVFKNGDEYFVFTDRELYLYNKTTQELIPLNDDLYSFTNPILQNGKVYFHSSSGTVWSSDGTAAETKQIGTENIGSFNYDPVLFAHGDSIFYNQTGTSEGDIWRMADLKNETDSAFIDYFPPSSINVDPVMLKYDGKLILNRRTPDTGHELWIYSGLAQSFSASLKQTGVVKCNGDSTAAIDLDILGGAAPYNIQWSPSHLMGTQLRDLPAGNYSATITDADGNVKEEDLVITEPEILDFTTAITPDDGTKNGSIRIDATGGTPPYKYWWPFGILDNNFYRGFEAGRYQIRVLDANNCALTDSVTVGLVTPVNNILEENVRVYPTITKNEIFIESLYSLTFEIYDQLGRLEMKSATNSGQNQIILPELPNGLYLIKLKKEEHSTVRKIFVSN